MEAHSCLAQVEWIYRIALTHNLISPDCMQWAAPSTFHQQCLETVPLSNVLRQHWRRCYPDLPRLQSFFLFKVRGRNALQHQGSITTDINIKQLVNWLVYKSEWPDLCSSCGEYPNRINDKFGLFVDFEVSLAEIIGFLCWKNSVAESGWKRR